MCEPMTIMAGVSMGMTLIGGLNKAEGERQAGRAAAQAGTYNRQVLQNQAIVARHNARRAGESTREAVGDLAEEGRALSGRQLVALAANGIVVNDGSALDLVADANDRTRRNIARRRQAGVDKQAGFISQAGDLEQKGLIAEIGGVNAQKAANIQATSTLLNTGGKVAGQWYDFSKEGVFDSAQKDPGDLLIVWDTADNNFGVSQ